MNTRKLIRRATAALAVITISGCAPAYHAYPNGGVPYSYCYPPPLPFTSYDACPTPVAQCYSANNRVTVEDTASAIKVDAPP